MKKILVANRGEIAIRVMRTCKEMGITTVAVFSDADKFAPHVEYADEAYYIGKSPSSESYLRGDKILEVALKAQVDGIHPGYGFLSENGDFADMVEKSGITFIGPSSAAMEVMGNKLSAKDAVKSYNIPLVPGSPGAIDDPEKALEVSKQTGFPVMVKAAAGGGGKGMRIVYSEDELKEQFERAVSEAKSSFGDGSVFIEKFIEKPKHIEIQVLGDKHGNIVYLFDRECSIQRRHQKVVEEAPSPSISQETREAMGKCAVDVARACNYYGAGTVEFIYGIDGSFYFLEMNTRLQVEHPVTEMITGIDLVKEQIKVARGEKLSFTQEDLKINGHSIEIRVYAEDPSENFLPSTGKLQRYKTPKGPGVRVDDGFEQGMDIPVFYDPMIAKLIVHASDRESTIQRMVRAIDEYTVAGVSTTLSFCKYVMLHPIFRDSTFDTNFVKTYFTPDVLISKNIDTNALAFSSAILLDQLKSQSESVEQQGVSGSNWKRNRNL
jgi:acetyl-CoA carboxylase biotin carboxylase subunit